MTNLERAAAIAAERGWPLVDVYRGWPVYGVDVPRIGYWLYAALPHEMDWDQARSVFGRALYTPGVAITPPTQVIAISAKSDIHYAIDRWEAAREAMPATAFFGIEEEVGI